jgi:hypothetical protein
VNTTTGQAQWTKPLVMGSREIEFDYDGAQLKGRSGMAGGQQQQQQHWQQGQLGY